MRIFEFHFNPTAKKDRFFKTFSSENFHAVGELRNALPQNSQFLSRLIQNAKEEFYGPSQNDIRRTLKKINSLLADEIKNGNVDWIGNLSVAFLTFSRKTRNSPQALSFAKSGDIKVLVARRDAFIDLGKNIGDFKNLVSGELLENDAILVCTKELYETLTEQNLLHDLAFFKEEKQFKELFNRKEKELSKISGVLFVVFPEAENKKTRQKRQFALPTIKISVPTIKFKMPFTLRLSEQRRKIVLISVFAALLLAGFLIFKTEQDKKLKDMNSALLSAKTEAANQNYAGAWNRIAPFLGMEDSSKEFHNFESDIRTKLIAQNKIEEIKKPESFFVIKKEQTTLIPNSMIKAGANLYFSNPFSSQIFIVDATNKKTVAVSAPKNVKSAFAFNNTAVFFEDPNTLLLLDQDNTFKEISLPLKQDFHTESMATFGESMYLFNSGSGELLKFPQFLYNQIAVQWLDFPSMRKAQGSKSLAIDGQAWLLKGNEIQRYYGGTFQEALKIDLFPQISRASRLKTSSSFQYLYLIDPPQKRLVILTKTGQIIQQYQSNAFDNLADIAISNDEHTIYLLNGVEVFTITR